MTVRPMSRVRPSAARSGCSHRRAGVSLKIGPRGRGITRCEQSGRYPWGYCATVSVYPLGYPCRSPDPRCGCRFEQRTAPWQRPEVPVSTTRTRRRERRWQTGRMGSPIVTVETRRRSVRATGRPSLDLARGLPPTSAECSSDGSSWSSSSGSSPFTWRTRSPAPGGRHRTANPSRPEPSSRRTSPGSGRPPSRLSSSIITVRSLRTPRPRPRSAGRPMFFAATPECRRSSRLKPASRSRATAGPRSSPREPLRTRTRWCKRLTRCSRNWRLCHHRVSP